MDALEVAVHRINAGEDVRKVTAELVYGKSCVFCERRATRNDEVQYNGDPEVINNGWWHRPTDRKTLGKTCQRFYLDVFVPGMRVVMFDGKHYVGDKSTPLSATMKVATIIRWYGRPVEHYNYGLSLGPYPSLVDIIFDDAPGIIKKGHFADYVQAAVEEVSSAPH